MVFSGLTFLLLFLPLLYLTYFICPSVRWRNGVLIIFSLIFYGWGEPIWICAMLFSTAVNYFCALLISRSEDSARRKALLIIGVIASVAFLFYFKYWAFLINSISALFGLSLSVSAPKLPIGISFYTFQILTYTVDVYRGKAKVLRSPMTLLLYISCFPQLIAGPIVQYADIEAQLHERQILPDDFSAGIRRFVLGLAKKILLANICGSALESLTLAGTGESMSLLGAWTAAFMYTLQIYFDFSAYSDMAIGLGRTLGFTYKENFDYPYMSRSVTEFWRRWHISLGSFFRDYVYIPLGGNRRGGARTALNILIVWTLTGLWHGASWNFVAWGAYYGLLLLGERFVYKKVHEALPCLLQRLITFIAVIFGWVLFYYTDFNAVFQHVLAMLGIGVCGITDAAVADFWRSYTVYPIIAFIFSTPVIPYLRRKLTGRKLLAPLQDIGTVILLAVSILFLVGQSYNPFIYFRF